MTKKTKFIKSHLPWAFSISVDIRRDWFSYLWTERGANWRDFQIGWIHISLGRPWLKHVVDLKIKEMGFSIAMREIRNANYSNSCRRFGFVTGHYYPSDPVNYADNYPTKPTDGHS